MILREPELECVMQWMQLHQLGWNHQLVTLTESQPGFTSKFAAVCQVMYAMALAQQVLRASLPEQRQSMNL